MDSLNSKSVHISEMMIGNPNTMVKDRSPMWKDFKGNSFERPFMVSFISKYQIFQHYLQKNLLLQ